MLPVKFIDNHDDVDVTEGNETEGEDAEGMAALGKHGCLFGSKQPGNGLGECPYEDAGDGHCRRDEAEGASQDDAQALFVSLSHLDGSERLECLACSGKEQVIDLQEVHAYGKGKDTRTSEGGEHNGVGREHQQGEGDGGDGQWGTL